MPSATTTTLLALAPTGACAVTAETYAVRDWPPADDRLALLDAVAPDEIVIDRDDATVAAWALSNGVRLVRRDASTSARALAADYMRNALGLPLPDALLSHAQRA